jgi:hypothetical protein
VFYKPLEHAVIGFRNIAGKKQDDAAHQAPIETVIA